MNNIKKLRTGVIGVGSMGRNHARVYSQESDLIGVCDLDQVLGNSVANEFQTNYFNKIENLLSKVDAVTVAVPTEYHHDVAIKCIESGVHILLEKPLASTIEQAKNLINMSMERDIVLVVGHIERYNPVIKYVKESINSNKWGNLITMSSKRLSSYPSRIRDVGVVMDLAIHDIDIMNYLSSSDSINVKSLLGFQNNKKFEDNALILIEYSNGVKGICEVNWLTPVKVRDISLTFDNAFVTINLIEQMATVINHKNYNVDEKNLFTSSQELKREEIRIEKEEPLKLEILDFLDSINSKRKPFVDGNDGLKALEIARKALK
ncbi:MAG: hypothetical protein CL678_14645 [Bdellovibrionaceae bacterium]|nr:hypothetical protein [Pseudobdellovibrionaceae bacterium]|tara:strand:- start:1049 stop:2008 length:960 start_codon:yes stop_codon:yes gene_type:complete